MSHHLDYPEPRLDITDVWCFGGTTGTVLVINVDPGAEAGFHPHGLYEFKIDTNGDAAEELTLRATFPGNDDGSHAVRLEVLTGDIIRDRDAAGEVVTPSDATTNQVITCTNGIRLFAGERADPFYNDARLMWAIKGAMDTGVPPELGDFDPANAENIFATSNVRAIVVELPTEITGTGTIGFWGTTALKEEGHWHQVQHAAGPLIGMLWDTPDFNASHPEEQKAEFGDEVVAKTAALVKAMETYADGPHGKATPEEYGEYVRDTVLPDILRYEVGTKAHYGPRTQNGRSLTEPSMESLFELALNKHVDMGLSSADAPGTLLDAFPYLSEPLAAE